MTGHSTCIYSLVRVCVVCQQSWLANSSWRPAHSSDNVLFGDASHCSLMTDSGGYTYFSHCYRLFIAPYGCTAQYLVKNKCYISLFLLIYFVVNSYIVNKTLKCTGAQPPGIEHHRTEGLRKKRPGVSITHTPEVSTPGEPPSSREREVGVVASLLLPRTPPRTLWPVHETRGAGLHMLGEVLWCLVQLAIAASTEECDP